MSNRRHLAQKLVIEGPAGALEAVLELPSSGPVCAMAVVCHPHPQHGGTMNNKVAHTLARSLVELGLGALRFNFRGVGGSEGIHDDGEGEIEDALAILDWAREREPSAPLWLGGFSFGACVALRAAGQRPVERLVAVAPPVDRCPLAGVMPSCPWLIVQGEADELVDSGQVERWARQLPREVRLVVLEGVDHFFHGRLRELRRIVHENLEPHTLRSTSRC